MLREEGLTLNDESNSFRFIHLMGAHWPYTLDKNGDRVKESDLIEQSEGSLGIVADYLQEMKRLGVYGNATIVVTADHGYWHLNADELNYASSPIMLVKPAETAEEAARPLRVSEAPTGPWRLSRNGHRRRRRRLIEVRHAGLGRPGGSSNPILLDHL